MHNVQRKENFSLKNKSFWKFCAADANSVLSSCEAMVQLHC
jgi:hypothetical protein